MRKGEREAMTGDYTGAWRALACALPFVAGLACAAPVTYRVDPGQTVAAYGIVYLGVFSQHGHFAGSHGTVTIDLAAREGKIEFTVDARSVDSGWGPRDAFIRDGAMLDAVRHPAIAFTSTRLNFAGERLVRIDGRLSLRGVTRDVVLDVARFECGAAEGEAAPECTAAATTTLRRSDYGMAGFLPLIDDIVTLDFSVVARR
jgi:polyisoprenoid-binding protein YceI